VVIVRMLVAPAVVTLLGDHARTLPRRLDRVLPEIDLEGEEPGDAEPRTTTQEDEVGEPVRAAA
jgi:putative drug exporter of the RND superfamily